MKLLLLLLTTLSLALPTLADSDPLPDIYSELISCQEKETTHNNYNLKVFPKVADWRISKKAKTDSFRALIVVGSAAFSAIVQLNEQNEEFIQFSFVNLDYKITSFKVYTNGVFMLKDPTTNGFKEQKNINCTLGAIAYL